VSGVFPFFKPRATDRGTAPLRIVDARLHAPLLLLLPDLPPEFDELDPVADDEALDKR
jgi:hypothetical protein